MIESAMGTRTIPFEIVVYADDDLETQRFLAKYESSKPAADLVCLFGMKRKLSEYWNDCAKAASGDILMLANDDLVFHTPGWAEKIEAEFAKSADKIIVAHADNGQPNASTFCTHPFVSRKWVETLGYLTNPSFQGDYTDTWIWDVGRRIDRLRYLPDVKIEHLHYTYRKSELDDTYKQRLAMENNSYYAKLFDTMAPERERDAEKLRAVMV